MIEVARASQAAGKGPHSFCHSERSEESLFLFIGINRREIPRFARNDKINYFFRSLFRLRGFVLARTNTHRLKPAPLVLTIYFFPFVTSFCTRQLFMSAM